MTTASKQTPFTADLDKAIGAALKKWNIPGASVSIVHEDQTWAKGFGLANVSEQTPAESKTLFHTGSTTKAMVCACWQIYIASEENTSKPEHERISWTTPLADIIRDDFVMSDLHRTAEVTLEDTVSHRTGLPRHELSYGEKGAGGNSAKELTKNLRNLPLHNTLRTHFEYTNIPYAVATHALETVTGKSFGQIVHDSLWEPLNMRHTYAGYHEAAKAVKQHREQIATGYSWSKLPADPGVNEPQAEEQMDLSHMGGAGLVVSTVEDYAKWMRALLNGDSPLEAKGTAELWQPRMAIRSDGPDWDDTAPFDGSLLSYGLGWFIGCYRGHKVVWHSGGLYGFGALLMLVPDLKWGITILGNDQNIGSTLRGLIFLPLDEVLGIPKEDRYAQQTLDEGALRSFEKMSEKMKEPRKRLYPSAPERAVVSHSLPLESYAGTFVNAGYGPITIVAEKSGANEITLISRLERTWKTELRFEHVNADTWIATRGRPDRPIRTSVKASSRVGADGKVSGWDIQMEPSMDVLMWFAKEE